MLRIAPVIAQADELADRIARDLPTHPGLLSTTRQVADAARGAEQVACRAGRLFGLHRLPAVFLLVAVAGVSYWTWWHFIRTSTVTIAVSDTDAVDLAHELDHRVQFAVVRTPGSRESLSQLLRGIVDGAFVQGGIEIPPSLPRMALPTPELVLLFLRPETGRPSDITSILTSNEGQGSHTVAQLMAHAWGLSDQVQFVFDWNRLVGDPAYAVPASVDAVLVVKDPLDDRLAAASRRLLEDGFELTPVDLGAAALGLRFLRPFTIRRGFLDPAHSIPAEPVESYLVSTYLVVRPDLSPRQLAAARRLVDLTTTRIESGATLSNVDEASEMLQGVEAFLGILVYIGLAFFALLGADIVLYRRRFHELNSLISLVTMHQAAKDVAGCDPQTKAHHIVYLSYCSDVLGLISAITGYYAQENSSLLYNKMLEIIPQRCDGLKLNIQIKILHALIDAPPPNGGADDAKIHGLEDDPTESEPDL